jgi:hypothetical protein
VPPPDTQHDWISIIRAECLEVPGLALTTRQAQRLWGLDERTCVGLLDGMVAKRFLRKNARDAYVRADSGRPAVTPSP